MDDVLEYGDIDFKEHKLTINKSYQHLNNKDVVTPPKTPKSNREISLPDFLVDELNAYTGKFYEIYKHDRIFPYTKRNYSVPS